MNWPQAGTSTKSLEYSALDPFSIATPKGSQAVVAMEGFVASEVVVMVPIIRI